MAKRQPNLLLIGIDSLRRDHMSLYGYPHQTSPHITKWAEGGTVFENCFSPHVPTTSGYGSMLTGRDCFGTNCVALRHHGQMDKGAPTLPEMLRKAGYNTSCVGFEGNPASRGFAKYLNFEGWGGGDDGRAHKAESLNGAALPELRRLVKSKNRNSICVRSRFCVTNTAVIAAIRIVKTRNTPGRFRPPAPDKSWLWSGNRRPCVSLRPVPPEP